MMADVEFSHNMGAYGRAKERQAAEPEALPSLATMTNMAGAVVSLALIAGVGVWGYKLMVRDVSGIPVVRAAEGDMRVRPEEPGGQLAEHQGLSVNEVAAEGMAGGPVEQIVLAPRMPGLAAEDQPITEPVVAPVIQPAPLPPAGTVSPKLDTVEAQSAPTADPERLQKDAIDAVMAELTSGSAPMVAVSGAKSVQPSRLAEAPEDMAEEVTGGLDDSTLATEIDETSDTAAATAEVATLEAPGVRSSVRPRMRPSAPASMVHQASYSAPAATAREIDANAIPAGTRLVQLGAFDSPDIARSEWARLQNRFGDYLENKSRVIQQAQSGGRTFYRLRAMGFVDLNDTRRFCSAFKAEGVDCIPVQMK